MNDDPDLVDFIARAAIHLAHSRGLSEHEVTRHILLLVKAARARYRQEGAPLGDTDDGFLAWLMPRHQAPAALIVGYV